MTSQAFTEVEILKKQLAEEVKEKYALYKRIKELTEELEAAKNKNIFNWNKSPELSSNSGPDEIQRYRT
jgi:predicted nuclease with TOPRIM domain